MKKFISLLFYIALVFFFSNNNLFAQIKLITTIPGVPALKSSKGDTHVLEFNNDGVPDIPFFKTDHEGNITLAVKDGDTDGADFLVWVTMPNGIIAVLIGFYNLDGIINTNNQKEIVVAEKKGNKYINPIIISSDDNYETFEFKSFDANSVFVAAGDVNGDGQADLVVFDPGEKEVQIWGY